MTAPAPQSKPTAVEGSQPEIEHTPTPWALDSAPNSNYGCQIAANTKVKAKRIVCRIGGPDRDANAAFIIEAVNSHAALKLAAQAMVAFVGKQEPDKLNDDLLYGLLEIETLCRHALSISLERQQTHD